MADITIVGLGPGPAEYRTIAVQHALNSAERIFVRAHADADLDLLSDSAEIVDLNTFRDPSAPHEDRWRPAVDAIIKSAHSGPVVLAIPGHSHFLEDLTSTTIRIAREAGMSICVLDGLSVIDLLCTALNLDPVRQRVQLMDGRDISLIQDRAPFSGGEFGANPRLPMLITHVYDNTIMRGLSTQLRRVLPEEHLLTLISHAGLPGESRRTMPLTELAGHPGGSMLAIYVPPMPELEATRIPLTLQHIVARLRREDGCPWDRKQTNASLASSLADEVYEVIDAINAEDDVNLAEELGDLLLLIMMHAQITEERGAFTLEDVYDGIVTKIVRRHPHVFGNDAAHNADEVVGLWQRIKQQERAERPSKPEKAADGQPHSMPALDRATRILKKQPIATTESTAESRQQALLDAVAAVVAAGEDPNLILKQALENHVTGTVSAGQSGENNAAN